MREQGGVFQAQLLLSLVNGVHQNKKQRKNTKNKNNKERKQKKKRKKKRKRKNQSIKDRRRARGKRKEKQVLWTRQCLNNVQNCQKKKKKRRAIVNWLRHGECEVITRLS